eukprot:CAMPEP_0117445150 /NCGR_PEP_ID=MMETSP0759-20121206/5638_1 /TAXON_ID=63605 /ORGANISM="Percolomonas cosmopolitus, Strain WS" /LENGTH=775 /DNA_ID=CAMNT_0005237299 /DNA_START=222 /DNA_END=2549 /DNA_ORIENTATION=-
MAKKSKQSKQEVVVPPLQKIDAKKFVYEQICKAVQELYSFDLHAAEAKVPEDKKILNQLIPPKAHLQDLYFSLCTNMFVVAKYLMKNKPKNLKPPQFAEEVNNRISEKLQQYAAQDPQSILDHVEPEGPFCNIHFKPVFVAQVVDKIMKRGFLNPLPEKDERVMIEYSQPNTHKTFHVGHMRNAALGNSLVKLYRHCGYHVEAVNYIGDVGTHIAKCLWYYLNFYPKKGMSIEDDVPEDITKVEFLGDMYSESCNKLALENYVKLPFATYVFARVDKIEQHPANPKWLVVQLTVGNDITQQVVCGGKGFSVGDIVAYAPVGAKKGKVRVSVIDKKGVQSVGCILSEKELGIGANNDKIHSFTEQDMGKSIFKTPEPGVELTEASRIPDTDIPADRNVTDVLKERNTQVKELLLRMESGEEEITNLWNLTRQWSIDDFKDIYKWTDSHFDFDFHESDVGTEGKEMAKDAFKKGILVESDGAIGADLSKHLMPGTKQDMGFLVLITSAGTGLYATKDLALAKRKFEEFKIDRSIYVVDSGQSLHFQQVFKTLELLGFKQASKCFHLAYGIVTLSEGKMSSRKGTVVFFSQLKKELTDHIMQNFLEKYRGDWSDEKIEETCRRIALATIKYGMLNQDNSRNIIFNIQEWASPVGNTGPYLMYAYTRTQSILREVTLNDEEKNLVDYNLLSHPTEAKLLTILEEFPETVEKAAEAYKPNLVCVYLYTLCKQFSRWYDSCSTKNASTPALKATRLELVAATGCVINKGLDLLGITTVDQM